MMQEKSGNGICGWAHRRTPPSGPKPLADALKAYVRQSGLNIQLRHGKLYEAWVRVVPEEFRKYTQLGGFRKQIVTIKVTSAAVLQELAQFWRDPLRQALIEELDGTYIDDVRFVLSDNRSNRNTHGEEETRPEAREV